MSKTKFLNAESLIGREKNQDGSEKRIERPMGTEKANKSGSEEGKIAVIWRLG